MIYNEERTKITTKIVTASHFGIPSTRTVCRINMGFVSFFFLRKFSFQWYNNIVKLAHKVFHKMQMNTSQENKISSLCCPTFRERDFY